MQVSAYRTPVRPNVIRLLNPVLQSDHKFNHKLIIEKTVAAAYSCNFSLTN